MRLFSIMKKLKIITLGCDKNLVDSEVLSGQMSEAYEISPEFSEGEAIIINTCGFIGDAKKQSIEAILEAIEEKKKGNFKKLLLTGCLIQRYYKELKSEFPEADGFFRLGDIKGMMRELGINKRVSANRFCERIALESDHTGYIKISDGCNHRCSYCAIPSIRGRYQSRSIDSILKEVEYLISGKVKEIILVGQEISSFGTDNYKKNMINDLLRELSKVCGKEKWIRLLYTHPPLVTRDFIETVATLDNVCNYIDFPIQHTESAILKSMGRADSTEKIFAKIKLMRKIIPDIVIRTSIITGFPGETVKVYNDMKKHLKELRFDRLGVFPYSLEEGTKASKMESRVGQTTAKKRSEEIMRIQQEISLENNTEKIGKIFKVLIDRKENSFSVGRTYGDSPDVDNEVLIKDDLEVGRFYDVKITDAEEFDLYGLNFTDRILPS
jgi:ribosomal protein S12 methylthiotransferase